MPPEPDIRPEMSVLLIDDEPAILRTLKNHLTTRGHRVCTAEGGVEGLAILHREAVDIVITDVKMPGMDGFEVLREVRRTSPGVEVIMVTAYGDLDAAVRAMREGAFDFFSKPVKLQELVASLHRTERFQALRKENVRYREHLDLLGTEARGRYGLSAILGESQAIQSVRNLIQQVCRTEATTVLICGETGTGKDLAARVIHYESARADGPFVAVDCSAIPQALVESEFYGHVKGAFTDARESRKGHFELADGGTLFLDEIGDMDLVMQTRLLRTLEERRVRPVGGAREIPVNVRVVSATNQDLPETIAQGKFRKDLYYRLNAFTIYIPPLRERPEDILPLASHLLEQYAREMRKPAEGFTSEAEALLKTHPFPGNVRELRNAIERAVILCKTGRVTPDDLNILPPSSAAFWAACCIGSGAVGGCDVDESLSIARAEVKLIREALRRSGGNRAKTAKLLGLSRSALHRRMAHYNLRWSNGGI